jgi:HlyD family secretion protein
VKKGQLLAEIDKSTLEEAKTQAQASVTSAQSGLLLAQQNFDRIKQLYDQKAATQVAYEDAVNQLAQAQASLKTSKSNLDKANVNLSYAEILSPIDGVILDRAVDQGQTVAASFNTPTLFTIANDLTKMQVEANVDEADIGNVRVGQMVNFSVDAYVDDIFEGRVNEVRLQPTVTNNVVTYTVIIDAPNPEEKLFPGMTANITIITNVETGVVVPNEALNFRPTEEVFKHYKMKPPKEQAKTDTKAHTANGAPNMNGDTKPNFSTGMGNKRGVWIEVNDTITRRRVEVGITDGVNTIVQSGLESGDKVILSTTTAKEAVSGTPTRNPLMPQRRR